MTTKREISDKSLKIYTEPFKWLRDVGLRRVLSWIADKFGRRGLFLFWILTITGIATTSAITVWDTAPMLRARFALGGQLSANDPIDYDNAYEQLSEATKKNVEREAFQLKLDAARKRIVNLYQWSYLSSDIRTNIYQAGISVREGNLSNALIKLEEAFRQASRMADKINNNSASARQKVSAIAALSELASIVGYVAQISGNYFEATAKYKEASAQIRKIEEPLRLASLATNLKLATSLSMAKKPCDAKRTLRTILDKYRPISAQPPEIRSLISSHGTWILHVTDDLELAGEFAEGKFRFAVDKFGEKTLDTAEAAYAYVHNLVSRGLYDDVYEFYSSRQRLLQPETRTYTRHAKTMAHVHLHRGQYDEAQRLFSDALKFAKLRLGENDPFVGWVYWEYGRSELVNPKLSANYPHSAIQKLELAFDLLKDASSYGPGVALCSLGTAYAIAGDTDRARENFARGLELLEESDGSKLRHERTCIDGYIAFVKEHGPSNISAELTNKLEALKDKQCPDEAQGTTQLN